MVVPQIPDWYFSNIGRMQRRPPESKLKPAIFLFAKRSLENVKNTI